MFLKDYKQSTFVNYFAEIYLPKAQANKLINDECSIDVDCIDSNSHCVATCNNPGCVNTPRVCRCKSGYFESLNLYDNNIKCGMQDILYFKYY